MDATFRLLHLVSKFSAPAGDISHCDGADFGTAGFDTDCDKNLSSLDLVGLHLVGFWESGSDDSDCFSS